MLQEIDMAGPTDPGRPKSSPALARTTGRDRAEWFDELDRWGAAGRQYREIADYLRTEHGLSNWWAQKLIVEYEEARGLRDPGVRRDGTFEVGASKTIEATPDAVSEAFTSETARERWLPGVAIGSTDPTGGRLRFDWAAGNSRVSVTLSETGGGRTTVVLQHDRIRDGGMAQSMKSFWQERLTELKRVLES
jgi:uncharacterized protein YndB with AHSA1/START domain